jgi:hypothetical protein
MHGGDAETFIGALVFDILDKVFKLSLAKFCGIRVMGRIISKDSIFWSAEPDSRLYRSLCVSGPNFNNLQSIPDE